MIRVATAILTVAATGVAANEVAVEQVPLDADVVVMGERHDIAQHHANQAAWVKRMAPSAIVFEMIPPDLGRTATDMVDAPAGELEAALAWVERGWTHFDAYHPIFEAAADARIFGAEVPRAALGAAMEDGAAAFMGRDAAALGLDIPMPAAERAAREAEQAEAHCGALPPEMLGGMVEAQRVRDAVLARTALDALEQTGGPVAVITGNGHARTDRGMPTYLSRARPDLEVIAIGQLLEPEAAAPYDVWVVSGTAGEDAGDPCAAFR